MEEVRVAEAAIGLARAAEKEWDPASRRGERRHHVGYYLIDRGRDSLEREVHFRASRFKRLRDALQGSPEVFYLLGAELLTFAIIAFLLSGVREIIPVTAAVLLLLLPASESAIEVINNFVTFLIPARPLPKLDFSQAIPEGYTTIVAVPSLLVHEAQVRQLVHDLEIRYLANRDPHLHFALLTDPPDSAQPFDEKDQLVGLCSELIGQLNARYAQDAKGSFFHLHRNRVYNAAENSWMGWERKRGKLLDFNNLLRGASDAFPVKVGDLSVLPKVRFVITLDSDTQLPRDSAHRLIGTLAHPLNRAVIDPATNTVVEGYGVLQPRVGVSVRSANRSRLASIYSGQTGLDTYTCAVSDVYQDLFGEGIFTGKGIYEVEIFQRVLGARFPSNAILSHDLIEGAYARAGLVSDVEVIDDYPSHFSAHSRRKHRWMRGDWQILRWLLPRVPDASGNQVKNPLGITSRWKIFDNLRRSVVECALFALLLAGWFFLPGSPLYWTSAIVVLMLIPSYVALMLAVFRAWSAGDPLSELKHAGEDFVRGQEDVLLMFALLAHQTLVTLDAVVRTVVRLTITRRRLLEWETAAQSETGTGKKTAVDIYLEWTPYLSIALALGLAIYRPRALPAALPLLVLWFCSKPIVRWLDRPLRAVRADVTMEDEMFLRKVALRTWRYFRVFASAENHWLIPDHVNEERKIVVRRLSPTNLGLQLNAQLAAYELGFVTLRRFVDDTERTFGSAKSLARFRGHFLNWYDTTTMTPQEPRFVSSVDSGNLVCSLWSLKQGCLAAAARPVLSKDVFFGIRSHVEAAIECARAAALSAEIVGAVEAIRSKLESHGGDLSAWVRALPDVDDALARIEASLSPAADGASAEVLWWIAETRLQLRDLYEMVENLMPWLLPEYAPLVEQSGLDAHKEKIQQLTFEQVAGFSSDLSRRIEELLNYATTTLETQALANRLREHLAACMAQAEATQRRLAELANDAATIVEEMDFRFLYNAKRKSLSVGYNAGKEHLEDSCYDLLASEARSATFVAIAKGDIPQVSWLELSRTHTRAYGRRVLVSWTGTMFEYLMPMLWMKTYPATLLETSMRAVVACQRAAVRAAGVPWGISESSCHLKDEGGNFQYHAFGIRALALSADLLDRLVIAPYATFLALGVDPAGAIENLRTMKEKGWLGAYGYYESADYGDGKSSAHDSCDVIPCWMAHHSGMSLLAAANLTCESVFQRHFHSEPMVAATERILHEKMPASVPIERRDVRSEEPQTATLRPAQ
ncbi:MAG: glucoamylase family protein [Candidatus Acidiferrales bacterium]